MPNFNEETYLGKDRNSIHILGPSCDLKNSKLQLQNWNLKLATRKYLALIKDRWQSRHLSCYICMMINIYV